MPWTPPAGVTPVDRKSPSAPTYADIPAVLDWLRQSYGGHTVVGLLITDRETGTTYRVDGEPAYGTAGTLSNYTLSPLSGKQFISGTTADPTGTPINGIYGEKRTTGGNIQRLLRTAGAWATDVVLQTLDPLMAAFNYREFGIRADTGMILNGANTYTGTDNRAAIQAWLDAHVENTSYVATGYYYFLGRKTRVARLPAGRYYIGARGDGKPSLSVPPGMTFDFTDATLIFQYPAAATREWCGIKLNQHSSVKVGRMFPRTDTPPDKNLAYDAIRVVDSDGNSRVRGTGESEIVGFRGAALRSIASWNVYMSDLEISGCAYIAVVGAFGAGLDKTGRFRTDDQQGNQSTAVWFDKISAANIRTGGYLIGALHGATGDFNTISYSAAGGMVRITDAYFENVAGSIMEQYGGGTVSMHGIVVEECGAVAQLMRCDTATSVWINNFRFIHTGRGGVQRWRYNVADDVITADPSTFLRAPSSKFVSLENISITNNYRDNLVLVNTDAPTQIRGIANLGTRLLRQKDASTVMSNTMVSGVVLDGTWNGTHLTLGNAQMWVDANGALRIKNGDPTSDTDGVIVGRQA